MFYRVPIFILVLFCVFLGTGCFPVKTSLCVKNNSGQFVFLYSPPEHKYYTLEQGESCILKDNMEETQSLLVWFPERNIFAKYNIFYTPYDVMDILDIWSLFRIHSASSIIIDKDFKSKFYKDEKYLQEFPYEYYINASSK